MHAVDVIVAYANIRRWIFFVLFVYFMVFYPNIHYQITSSTLHTASQCGSNTWIMLNSS